MLRTVGWLCRRYGRSQEFYNFALRAAVNCCDLSLVLRVLFLGAFWELRGRVECPRALNASEILGALLEALNIQCRNILTTVSIV